MKRKIGPDLVAGAILIGIIFAAAFMGAIHPPFDPYAMNTSVRFLPPSPGHFLGTDSFGRDNFSRIVVGVRYTLLTAVGTVAIGLTAGTLLGLTAGFFGGVADEIIMRIIDAFNSFPMVLLALVTVTVLHKGRYTIIAALGIAFTPSFARIVRSETLRIKSLDYIKLAQVFGAPPVRIMSLHLFPNMAPSLLSSTVIGFSNAVLAESAMSYLGLGIQPPAPSLGRMLYESQANLFYAPWDAIAPGIAIIITVMGFNLLGEGIRRIL